MEKELKLRDKEHQPETEKEVSKQLDACLLTSEEFDLDCKLFKDPLQWDIPERAK